MSYLDFDERNRRSTSWHTEWVCLLAFVVFTFTYLFFYQSDILAAGQHVLSGGQTHYRSLVGAVLITLVLLILQRCVFRLTRLSKRAHALTYLPSLLVLTVITDVSSNIDKGFSFGGWLIAVPLILVAYCFLVVFLMKMEPFEPEGASVGFLSRTSWINLLTMVVMFVLVGLFSNSDEAFHYRMRMERLLLDGKTKEALRVGRRSEVTDNSLTMLRAYALACEGQLGNRFFEYPVTAASFSLVPDGEQARTVLLPDSVITLKARRVGVRADHKLLQLLADRKLSQFAALVQKAYPDSLMPKHYAEALAMYQHLVALDTIAVADSVMLEAFADFCAKEHATPKASLPSVMRKAYGRTYWYYYKYGWKED
ncbi:MAG: hypothetical protein J5637_02010 [Prevotella sp.]|nr:hypothetical protein [Prevotella sp.]